MPRPNREAGEDRQRRFGTRLLIAGGLFGAVSFVLALLGDVSALQTALSLLVLVSAVVGLVTTQRGR